MDYRLRIIALIICLGCVWIFAIAVQANLPWLVPECRRSEPWKLPFFWLSEATALLLFVEYTIAIVVSGANRAWRPRNLTIGAFIVGTCLNVGIALLSMVDEYRASARAIQVPAEVVKGTARRQNAGFVNYTFTCTFRDRDKTDHTAWFSYVQNNVPANVREKIEHNQLPVITGIMYDPLWPGRTWLADVPHTDDNRLFVYSFISILFSSLLTALLIMMRKHFHWLPPPGIGPFIGMTALFCASAFLQGW
jgi:hypothetical protein